MNDLTFERGWLRGIFDGEGTVNFSRRAKNSYTKTISMSNTDKSIINKVLDYLNKLSIKTHISYQEGARGNHLGKKRIWSVRISDKDSIRLFASLINFNSMPKKEKLYDILFSYDSYCVTCGELIEEGLRIRKYCKSHLSNKGLSMRMKRSGRDDIRRN